MSICIILVTIREIIYLILILKSLYLQNAYFADILFFQLLSLVFFYQNIILILKNKIIRAKFLKKNF